MQHGEEMEKQEREKQENLAGTTCEHKSKRQQMATRMNSVWWAIALASAAMAATAIAVDTHEVGGDKGWAIPEEMSFYATWAANNTFKVGDILEFKWNGTHTVLEVSKDGFENCTHSGTPQNTSPVRIPLDTAGPKYFICTVGLHCSLGQKLNVTVGSNNSTTPATPAAPAPSSAPASLLANALSAAMFAVGSILFTCL